MRRGIAWKVVTFYGIMVTLDAIYDVGMYASFFVNGPFFMHKLMALDESTSFGAIQTQLFVRWCASNEIRKATKEAKKRSFTELVLVRSFRNQARDAGFKWMNFMNFLGIYRPKRD